MSDELKVCPKCGWYILLGHGTTRACYKAEAKVAQVFIDAFPDVESTKLGYGDERLTFDFGSGRSLTLWIGRRKNTTRPEGLHWIGGRGAKMTDAEIIRLIGALRDVAAAGADAAAPAPAAEPEPAPAELIARRLGRRGGGADNSETGFIWYAYRAVGAPPQSSAEVLSYRVDEQGCATAQMRFLLGPGAYPPNDFTYVTMLVESNGDVYLGRGLTPRASCAVGSKPATTLDTIDEAA